jgi:CTP:molybdopterin cytidylyltransferase MocA
MEPTPTTGRGHDIEHSHGRLTLGAPMGAPKGATMAPMVTIAVVLAAGGGTRFAGPTHKLAAPLRGRTVASWAVQAAIDAAVGPVVVVTGAVRASALDLPPGVTELHNHRWAEGQATSLQLAVAHARTAGADAVVVGVADQPMVTAEAWRRVAAGTRPITTATFDGERRPPVRLAAEVWPLLPTSGDEGARVLLRRRPELVGEVACPGVPADIDTVEDLDRWSS